MSATRTFVTLALVASLIFSGCALRGDGRDVAYAVDATAVVVGAGLLSIEDECFSTVGCPMNSVGDRDEGPLVPIAVTLIIGGLVGALFNLMINRPEPQTGPAPLRKNKNRRAIRSGDEDERPFVGVRVRDAGAQPSFSFR